MCRYADVQMYRFFEHFALNVQICGGADVRVIYRLFRNYSAV